jgi:DNA-binding NtrC family response regulator
MMRYDWPGNVRELENCIERAVALGYRETIDAGDLPPALCSLHQASLQTSPQSRLRSLPADTDLEVLERKTIQRVFEQVQGDKTLAGKMLGISRATLYRKLKRYNIPMRNGGLPPRSGSWPWSMRGRS